ncbi:MAG: cytochrome c oxidase assembly protein [Kouleothrix sp.]|nr:cytochrome c oxidase assembly protein [Kouleothrix sp.]
MTTWQLLRSTWHGHPSVLLGCLALLLAYLAGLRRVGGGPMGWRMAAFAAGVAALLLALLSPLHALGDGYLFSAHMLQHLLLLQIVPPLLLLGLPPALIERLLRRAVLAAAERALGQPLAAWLLGSGAVWAWHLPSLYNAALASEPAHIAEHLCFLATATIFWWPVLAPGGWARLGTLPALLYLFAAAASSSALGILLAATPPGMYPAYLRPTDRLGILPLLRDGWGLTPAVDQQLGGLLMWIAGGLLYLGAMLGVLARWYGAEEDERLEIARPEPRSL